MKISGANWTRIFVLKGNKLFFSGANWSRIFVLKGNKQIFWSKLD